MAKQIQIRIFPDGHIETVTKNIKGKQCLKYLQPLEQLLDAQVTDSEFTSEYYESEVEETTSETVNVNNQNT
jgi:hypothetical protein